MHLEFIKNYLKDYPDTINVFKRNLVKEYLQILALSFVYSTAKWSDLIFYGGSSLRYCYGLNRLSEDLDFVDLGKKIGLSGLASDTANFFKKELGIEIKTKIQKFRIYLKFPILHELKLANSGESNLVNLKIEVFRELDFCKNFKTEIIPVFYLGKSILIKTFDLPTLMATKVRAILYRKWEKTDKKGKTTIKAKGRDYYDLMWYFQKGILPNLSCIENIKTKEELKIKLLNVINRIDPKSIELDLESLIADKGFAKNLSREIKNILVQQIEKKL